MFSKQSVCEFKKRSVVLTTTQKQLHTNMQYRQPSGISGTEADHTKQQMRHQNFSHPTFPLYWPLPSDITIKGCLWLAETQIRLNGQHCQSPPVMRHFIHMKCDIFNEMRTSFECYLSFQIIFSQNSAKIDFCHSNEAHGSLLWTQECTCDAHVKQHRGDILLLLPLLTFTGPGVLRAPLRAASGMETHSNYFCLCSIWDLLIFHVTAFRVHSNWQKSSAYAEQYFVINISITDRLYFDLSTFMDTWKVWLQREFLPD